MLRKNSNKTRLLCALVSVFSIPVSKSFAADKDGLILKWEVAAECMSYSEALAAIDESTEHRALGVEHNNTVKVEITRGAENRWDAFIRIEGPGEGERRFSGDTCRDVAEAGVLIVAIAIDPVSVVEHVRSLAQPPVVARSPKLAEKGATEGIGFLAGVRAVGDSGSLPKLTSGFSVVLGVQVYRIRIEGEGTLWLPRYAGTRSRGGGEIALYTGALYGYLDVLHLFQRRLRIGPCLGAEMGLSSGTGAGLRYPQQARGLWGAFLGGLYARQVNDSSISPEISAQLGTPLSRLVYVVDDTTEVFQARRLLVRVSLSLVWLFQ